MADVYSFAERVQDNLTQVAARKHVDLRRILGHARLLDTLVAELSVLDTVWDENGVHDEDAAVGSEGHDCDSEDSDSDSDSDSDWDSDTDSDSETDSDPDSGSEWPFSEDFNQKIPEDFSHEKCCDESTACPKTAQLDWDSGKFQNDVAGERNEMGPYAVVMFR